LKPRRPDADKQEVEAMTYKSSYNPLSNLAQRQQFMADRKAAGRWIDIETCGIKTCYVDLTDPYGIGLDRPRGPVTFVVSAETGWVLAQDLPQHKRDELQARIERGDVGAMDDELS
jgi:hypothetical protein